VHTFDSQREADYYADLVLRRRAGEITDLELQRSYALIAHKQAGAPEIIGYYEADFVFAELVPTGRRVVATTYPPGREVVRKLRVVDVKGVKTQLYALKKKLAEACWGIEIEEA
jgi:hypothetical protein